MWDLAADYTARVLAGSQRSSDRPSSDAALNLMNSVRIAAECRIAEVMLCMFGPTSDNDDLLHRGTRCRKMHSSYRSTFRTVGATPLATVSRCAQDSGSHVVATVAPAAEAS